MKNLLKKIDFFKTKMNKNKNTNLNGNYKNISVQDFVEYIEAHPTLLILTFIVLIVSHCYILLNSNVGIDIETFINNPKNNYNWIEIGRFGLVVEKLMLHLNSFSMFFAEAISIIFLFMFNTVMYYAFYKMSGKDLKLLNIIFPLICFTNPIWAEQFIFVIQIAQISFSLLLMSISLLLVFKWLIEKSNISFIFSNILLVLVFATYQSFIPIYIALCIFMFILMYENNEYKNILNKENELKKDNKTFWIFAIKLIISFAIPMALYAIVNSFLPIDNSYLNSTNAWKIAPSKRECVKNIYYYIKAILKGESLFYNTGLTISMFAVVIIGIINAFKNKNINSKVNKFFYYCVYLLLLVTPFLLTIYAGQPQVIRAAIYIPIIEAILVLYMTMYIVSKVKFKVVSFVLFIFVMIITFEQLYYLESLYYTDSLTREKDKQIALQIVHDLKANGVEEGSTLYFYGHYNGIENNSTIKGQLIGISSFEFNHTMEPLYYLSSQTIVYLMRAYGYNYGWLPIEKVPEAREIANPEDIPSWPKEGSIIKNDDYTIVKINQY